MKIALVSYECAGEAGGGGIGTYIRNTAEMLSDAGHRVHVFTHGVGTQSVRHGTNLTISTVPALREKFPAAVFECFRTEQEREGFDLIEGPEFGCDAKVIANVYPQLPFVVRLHGPSSTIANSNAHYIGWRRRWRFALGALRRGRWPRDPWKPDIAADPERAHAHQADEIVANSRATADYCKHQWGLPQNRLSVVPLSFTASQELLALEPAPNTRLVLFLGRLEVRKGILELARAMPLVLRQHPDVTFRLVGRILPHPDDGKPLAEHVLKIVGDDAGNVQIVDSVPYEAIVGEFARASICVFPSDWEASGFVCLEGMAAGRAVIGSKSGGMAEIIDDERNGLLVPNRNPAAIATALNRLLASPETCRQMGAAARQTIVERYAPEVVLPLHLAAYDRAIANAKARVAGRRYELG